MRVASLIAMLVGAVLTARPAAAQDDLFRIAQANHVLAKLDSLPTTLQVTHSPNPATAVEDSTTRYRYTWHYSTSVQSTPGEVTIVEFGCLARVNGQWRFGNITGESFRAEQFAAWYECEGAALREGVACTDANNWGGSTSLQEQHSLWYYFGVDEHGRQVAGSAEITGLPSVAAASE